MFAVIKTGGKQYRVEEGSNLEVEKLVADVGAKIKIDDVLLVNDGKETRVGRPNVEGASVELEVVDQTKGDKVIIFKKIRRHGKQLKKGHRQKLTAVRVANINC